MESYNIILVGKTGHGKSSTGNTILRRETFDTTDNAANGSTLVAKQYSVFDNFAVETDNAANGSSWVEKRSSVLGNVAVHVYDTPGLMDSELTEKEDKERGRRNMDIVFDSTKTLSALMLVYKYNMTFSQEESKTIDILKEFFGEIVFAKHAIIVVTCGDVLDKDVPAGQTSESFFTNWCTRQKPKFTQLLQQVNNRILLVNNKGNFSVGSRRLASSKQILEMVIQLQNENGVYSKGDYEYRRKWCKIF